MPAREAALYPSLLGDRWAALAPRVQRLHESGARARGTFDVRRGTGFFARVLATLLRMPRAAERVAISLRVERTEEGERWTRTFGDHPVATTQWRSGDLLVEAMGLTQCWFRLLAAEGALVFEQVKARFGLRRFAVPMPRWIAPRITGRAEARADMVHVSVQIGVPLVGLIVSYEGSVMLEIEAAEIAT